MLCIGSFMWLPGTKSGRSWARSWACCLFCLCRVCRDRPAVTVARGRIMTDGLVTTGGNKFQCCQHAQPYLLPFCHWQREDQERCLRGSLPPLCPTSISPFLSLLHILFLPRTLKPWLQCRIFKVAKFSFTDTTEKPWASSEHKNNFKLNSNNIL